MNVYVAEIAFEFPLANAALLTRVPFLLLFSCRRASEVSSRRRDVSSRLSSSAAAACAAWSGVKVAVRVRVGFG